MAIFHLPKSTKFESFQMLSSSFINYIAKENSTSLIVMISFESYYENSLKTLTKVSWKGHHLSVQYEVVESTDISNVSMKALLSHKQNKQGLTQFFRKASHKSSKELRYFFCTGNGKTHILKNNGTIDVASNNLKESDTLMHFCLGLVDLENKVVCVKSNDTDVFTNMVGNYEKLNGLTY